MWCFTLLWLVTTAGWIYILIRCLKNKDLSNDRKLFWLLIMLATYVVGAVVYGLVVMRNERRDGRTD